MAQQKFNEVKICPLQLEFIAGDVLANCAKIVAQIKQIDADIFIAPELALNGNCDDQILDLALYQQQITQAINQICAATKKLVIVGGFYFYPNCSNNFLENDLQNCLLVFADGNLKHIFPKYLLNAKDQYKNYGKLKNFNYQNYQIALFSTEDELFRLENNASYLEHLASLNLDLIILSSAYVVNFAQNEPNSALDNSNLAKQVASKCKTNVLHINPAGAAISEQFCDILIGASLAFNAKAQLVYKTPIVNFPPNLEVINWQNQQTFDWQELNQVELIYQSLVIATRAYVQKYNFNGVILGLSGGIDSALTLAIAVDALGADKVTAVMLPYLYTSDASISDAKAQADALKVKFELMPIAGVMDAFNATLAPVFAEFTPDVTEENLQARARAVILMAIANKKGLLLLNTGNKSELATGYCTLYGDMAGGFAPLKDVFKTQVFALAKYRNAQSAHHIIPERVIERAPSAELAPNQTDQDILPPYEQLDKILRHLLIYGLENDAYLADHGFAADVVQKVLKMLEKSKFKRDQAAIGPNISDCPLNK